MILKRLKLVNYGGIYNGLGLNEIEIDFTRCKHRIILIKGDNGSGKSTIESALKPLPDDNTSFISGKDAMKEIEYIDELAGIIYTIRFIHECKGSNNSRTTKGYFTKVVNGTPIEMNPSGNITGCRDIIYDELQLDPNYITLTQLSNTKRGIADLKPAERKRYVNAILSATDVYNDMYKVLTKKASTYKSMMQSIVSKLDNIGNIAQLKQTIDAIDTKIGNIESTIERHTEIMNKEKGMLHSIDPDNKLRERIEYLTKTLNEYKSKRNSIEIELNKLFNKYPVEVITDITPSKLAEMSNRLIDLNSEASSIKSKISMLIESRRCDSDELQSKTAKLQSINSAGSLSEVKKLKKELTGRKQIIEARWNNVINLNGITADEFMNVYEVICEMLDTSLYIDILPEVSLDDEYRNCVVKIKAIDDEIEQLVNYNNRILSAEDKIAILEQRPTNCNNDGCPFIADALQAKKMLDEILEARRKHKNNITQLNKDKEKIQEFMVVIDDNKYLLKLYKANQRILKSINFGLDTFDDCMRVLKTNGNVVLSTLKGMLEYTNDIEEYKKIVESLNDIENKFHSLSSQEDFINMITSDISRIQNQINNSIEMIESYNSRLDSIQSEYTEISAMIDVYTGILSKKASLSELDDGIRILQEEIDTNKANIDKLQKINSDIEKLSDSIAELKEHLKPLKEERESLGYKMRISVEYNNELEQYRSMYEKIDTLKYYCSPTTGIQLLFANMYLSKILDNANRILCNLFGGIFALLPLVITDTEFKIPVAVNGGLNHDDITSMSSAQVSLISMIISISLLSQTSTKLNIIVGDEIDAPFDSENRREFITILYQLMTLVNSSQCVLISHNSEIPMGECDVILLKCDNDIINEGNIIWSYR